MPKKLISLIVPVFNEEENIHPFYQALTPILDKLSGGYNFEIIFTDNHSSDNTFDNIKRLSKIDPRIRVYRFSKNFGYQKSIFTGYIKSKGDACIQLDCDLQDPLDLIPIFIDLWNKGNMVVYGIRLSRKENKLITLFRLFFYRLVRFLSENELPLDAGDFRLIDVKIVEVLRNLEDASPYLRGTIASIGFKQIGVPYHRKSRERGISKFKLRNLISLAIDGIVNHSVMPLRIASFFGILVSLLTILLIVIYIVGKLFHGLDWPAGFTTLTVLTLFGISLNALFLGIIGEYLGRIYKQVKKHPITILEDLIE